jgi:hypothetical protein
VKCSEKLHVRYSDASGPNDWYKRKCLGAIGLVRHLPYRGLSDPSVTIQKAAQRASKYEREEGFGEA